MKTSNNPTISALSDKKREFIKFVCSPGTAGSYLDAPNMVCPTGEKCMVMREMRMRQITLKPDDTNRIIVLNTPFFEAPLIHVQMNANGIAKIQAYQLPGYPSSDATGNVTDQLKANEIYGWRMIANSVTGVCDAAPIDATGNVTVASIPLSLDNKVVYSASANPGEVNPVSFARCLDYIPFSANDIAGITNQFTTHKAIDGSYCVLKHTDPHLPFVYRNSDMNKATFNVYRYNTTGLEPTQATTTTCENRLCFANASYVGCGVVDENDYSLPVTAPSCMNLGLTIFSGLKPNTPFTFKMVVAWEFIPKMNSSKIAQCRPMEPIDPFFMHVLNLAELRTRSYGTAADNSLGTFLKGMVAILSKASPFVKEIASVLPLPGPVKMVVDKVTDIIPKVNSAIEKVNKQNKQNETKKTQEVAIVNKGSLPTRRK